MTPLLSSGGTLLLYQLKLNYQSAPPLMEKMPHCSLIQQFLEDERTTNLYKYDRGRHTVHVALIVKRGKVLAEAFNNYGNRSMGSGYSDFSIHAEKNVIKQLGDISKLRGSDLYVMRVSSDRACTGNKRFMNSKPCKACELFLRKCMKEYGLNNVYYTS